MADRRARRRCPRCNTPKPCDELHFYKRGAGWDSWCIECRKLTARVRYARAKRAARVRCRACGQMAWKAERVAR